MRRKNNQIRTIDSHIGRQLRAFRLARGLTQKELGGKLGISHQQLYKYENGSNSLSASMLYDVAKVLQVPPTIFFDGITETLNSSGIYAEPGVEGPVTSSREHIALLRKLNAVRPDQRVALLSLLRSMLVEEMTVQ